MSYAIQCFGEPGVEIIHPTPAFPIYESMINFTGAKACSFGKMFLFSLAAGGQKGVEHLLQNMHDEIKRNMVLMGCKNLKELNNSKLIYRK